MFSFLRRTPKNRTQTTRARRNTYRPTVEGLEDRKVMSVAAGALDAKSFYFIDGNRELWFNHLDGLNKSHWVDVASKVAEVSAGTDEALGAAGHETAFIRLANGTVWECHDLNGNLGASRNWTKVFDSQGGSFGVVQISASQTTPNRVNAIFSDGTLWTHTGLNSQTGWVKVDKDVAKVQASQFSQGIDDAIFLTKTGTVKVYTSGLESNHYQPFFVTVATGIKDISAAPRATNGDVFVLSTNGTLTQHIGTSGQSGTDYGGQNGGHISSYDSDLVVATGVAQMSANDAYVQGSVFAVKSNGALYEYEQAAIGGKFYATHLADNVVSISAVTPLGVNSAGDAFTLDNVYVQTKDGHVHRYSEAWNPHPAHIQII